MSFRRAVYSCFTPALFVLSLAVLSRLGNDHSLVPSNSAATLQVWSPMNRMLPWPARKFALSDAATGASQTTLTNDTGRYVVVNVSAWNLHNLYQ